MGRGEGVGEGPDWQLGHALGVAESFVSPNTLTAETRLSMRPDEPGDTSVLDAMSAAGSRRHTHDMSSTTGGQDITVQQPHGVTPDPTLHALPEPRCVWTLLNDWAECLKPPTRNAVPSTRRRFERTLPSSDS